MTRSAPPPCSEPFQLLIINLASADHDIALLLAKRTVPSVDGRWSLFVEPAEDSNRKGPNCCVMCPAWSCPPINRIVPDCVTLPSCQLKADRGCTTMFETINSPWSKTYPCHVD